MKKISYNKTNNRILFSLPYNEQFITEIKKISGRWFDWENKLWTLPNQRYYVDHIAKLISLFNFKLDESLSDSMFSDFLGEEVEIGSPIEPSEKFITKYDLPLRKYQWAGVEYMISRECVINGDDMGLGKTLQSIVTIEYTDSFPCIVVCPASVKYNWKREWNKWFPDREVKVYDESGLDFGEQVYVVGYSKVKDILKELRSKKWECIVCDEAHFLKNSKSQRTVAVRKLSKDIRRVILLSGTLTLNQTSELISPLTILRKFGTLFGNWKQFVIRYCGGVEGRYGWEIDNNTNSKELNQILRKYVYIRREKREVEKELPSIQHTVLEVNIDNKSLYRSVEEDLYSYLKKYVSEESADRAMNAEGLVLLSTLMKLTGESKWSSICEFIDSFLSESNEKLLVFGVHRALLSRLSTKYKCDYISGSTTSDKRLSIVDDFKTSSKRVLFGNIQSLGTGVDGLQDICSNLLFIELPSTRRPSDIDQPIGRIERIGQKSSINVYYLLGKDTIDEVVWEDIENKREVTDMVNKGRKRELDIIFMKKLINRFGKI